MYIIVLCYSHVLECNFIENVSQRPRRCVSLDVVASHSLMQHIQAAVQGEKNEE
jgi:hypothetical protein